MYVCDTCKIYIYIPIISHRPTCVVQKSGTAHFSSTSIYIRLMPYKLQSVTFILVNNNSITVNHSDSNYMCSMFPPCCHTTLVRRWRHSSMKLCDNLFHSSTVACFRWSTVVVGLLLKGTPNSIIHPDIRAAWWPHLRLDEWNIFPSEVGV